MKTSYLRQALLAATLFLGASAPARAGEPEMKAPEMSSDAAALLKRYDANHDGKLDDDEKATAKLENLAAGEGRGGKNDAKRGAVAKAGREQLKKFDHNGDGKLDADERADLQKAARARIEASPRLLKRFDKNADGKLDDAEWAGAREEGAKRLREARQN